MRKVLVQLLAVAASAALLAAAGVVVSAQQGVGDIITASMFQSMLPHRGDNGCPGAFYTYDAFIQAAGKFPGFGTNGDDQTRRRELAAFFGQTSHETNGGWATATDGPFAWGYCFVEERGQKTEPPYYGRGPIQLSHKYNYEQAGQDLQQDLVGDPGLVSRDPVVSFETAIWFWMTPQGAKPSCHAVITNGWKPSADDTAAGRVPGYGLLTNIINGGIECGPGRQPGGDENRVGYYQRYCQMLGVTDVDNLSCQNQQPYANN